MRRVLFLLAMLMAPVAVPAQEVPPPGAAPRDAPHADDPSAPSEGISPDIEHGLGLLEEGARSFLRGFMEETEPRLRELQRGVGEALSELQPELRRLQEMLGDLRHYEAPERLPNGDVLIRRSPDAPPYEPPADEVPGEGPQNGPEAAPEDGVPGGPRQDEPIEL